MDMRVFMTANYVLHTMFAQSLGYFGFCRMLWRGLSGVGLEVSANGAVGN